MATRAVLRFPEEDWDPEVYLQEFYPEGSVYADEREALSYELAALGDIDNVALALELGCGPTVHRSIAAARYVAEIHMADYMPANLQHVSKWLNRAGDRHGWTEHVRYVLETEGLAEPTPTAISRRESLTRERVRRVLQCDLRLEDPLGDAHRELYPLVYSFFCAESATGDRETWARYVSNLSSLVAPRGHLVLGALRNASRYRSGSRWFPCAPIDENDLRAVLTGQFASSTIDVQVRHLPTHEPQGYSGILLGRATKLP
jgi:hypothetical protein